MTRKQIWKILGIEPTHDKGLIRKAYARALKLSNPEDDPSLFQGLRQAYELALTLSDEISEPIEDQEDEAYYDYGYEGESRYEPYDPQSSGFDQDEDYDEALVESGYRRVNQILRQIWSIAELDNPNRAEKIAELFDALIADEAFSRIDLNIQIEEAVISFIYENLPLSDVIIDRAISVFEWDKRKETETIPEAVEYFLQRQQDLLYLNSSSFAAGRRDAWIIESLKSPLKPLTFWPRLLFPLTRVRFDGVLRQFYNDHPTIANEFNQESVDYWAAQNAKATLPNWSMWALLSAPLWLGIMAFVKWKTIGWGFTILIGIIPGTVAAMGLITFLGIRYPKEILLKLYEGRNQWPLRLGFMVFPIGLCFLSAFVPRDPLSWVMGGVITILSILCLGWSQFINDHIISENFELKDSVHFVPELLMVLWWLSFQRYVFLDNFLPMTASVIAASYAAYIAKRMDWASLAQESSSFTYWPIRTCLFLAAVVFTIGGVTALILAFPSLKMSLILIGVTFIVGANLASKLISKPFFYWVDFDRFDYDFRWIMGVLFLGLLAIKFLGLNKDFLRYFLPDVGGIIIISMILLRLLSVALPVKTDYQNYRG